MNRNKIIGGVLIAFVVVFAAQYSAMWMTASKINLVGKFNLAPERITKDLDGRAVSLMLNQVWPFESSQSINIQIVGKKQVDDFVIIVIDVKALAPVQQVDIPKEQFSTTTTSKDVPKTPPKLPSKLQLSGRMKLTYELVDGDWYLLGMENLNLKAVPID